MDPQAIAEELSTLDDGSLFRIVDLVRQQVYWEQRIVNLSEELNEAHEILRSIAEDQLPDAMDEHGVRQLKMADGNEITVNNFYNASIPKSRTEEAFEWLRDNQYGDLIKNVVTATFGRNEDSLANKVLVNLQSQGYATNQKQWVEPMTLKAFVKEQIEKGTPIPSDLFGVYIGKKAKVRWK
jgi:hypothetical protein